MRFASTLTSLATLMLMTVLLTGCGGSVEGTYTAQGTSPMDSITLKAGGKAEVKGMGQTEQATYHVDGKKVKISIKGATEVFNIDDKGCLVSDGVLGTLCKK